MNSDGQSSPLLKPWRTESLRFSAFFADGTGPNTDSLWQKITGQVPESEKKQPRAGILEEEGSWENARLVTISRGERADIIYAVSPPPEFSGAIPTIGEFDEAFIPFKRAVDVWRTLGLSAQRLAIGMVLIHPVDDRVAGYRKLGGYLPAIDVDPEGSRDFLYRVNRPRRMQIGAADIAINRLSTWSVAYLTTLVVVASDRPTTTPKTKPTDFAIRLELDINTDSDFTGTFNPQENSKLIDTMFAYAIEIAQKGELA